MRFGLAFLTTSIGLVASFAYGVEWRDIAVAEIKKEPKVVDAMFTQNISLWVSVADDGSNRDGFASYLCLLLADAGMQEGDFVVIKVWDAAAMAREKMTELGRHECAK